MGKIPEKDDKQDQTLQFWGWILFVLCSALFIVSSIKNRDPLSLAASIIFLLACLIFMIPLVASLRPSATVQKPKPPTGGNPLSDVTQYLYRIQPTRPEMLAEGPTPEEAEIVSQHFAYLKDLTEQGVVVLAGRTLNVDESSFGIVIFNADSEEAAHEVMNDDPAVRQGVMQAELFPYRVALMAQD
jgi:uncharacterized protein YciI/uncharacterized membrane protein YtjA (UPF0391 family)